MRTCNPDLKQIFPEAPMISRQAPNIPEIQCESIIQGTRATSPYYLQK